MVVCAANLNTVTGVIYPGPRHFDSTMLQLMPTGRRTDCMQQGFIDQRGVFLTRQEAWKVAEAAGQIRRRVGGDAADGGTLYSENLY